mmetsp:Transcript_10508/g.20262  ORF Transcript_10508/g.20262 Transcript_10508/m.20262 type:complete len:260 (+) Transcript_10508:1126-1905(+)
MVLLVSLADYVQNIVSFDGPLEALQAMLPHRTLEAQIGFLPCAVVLAATVRASSRANRGAVGNCGSAVLNAAWAFLGGLATAALPSFAALYLMPRHESWYAEEPKPVAVIVNATMLAMVIWACHGMSARLLGTVTAGIIIGSIGWVCFLHWLYTTQGGKGRVYFYKPDFLKNYLPIHSLAAFVTILPFAAMTVFFRLRLYMSETESESESESQSEPSPLMAVSQGLVAMGRKGLSAALRPGFPNVRQRLYQFDIEALMP